MISLEMPDKKQKQKTLFSIRKFTDGLVILSKKSVRYLIATLNNRNNCLK